MSVVREAVPLLASRSAVVPARERGSTVDRPWRPADGHELEHVGARRSASTAGTIHRRCACGGIPGPTGECAECRAKRLAAAGRAISSPTDAHEVEAARVEASFGSQPPLARASAEESTADPSASVDDVLRSEGRPLDASARASMERYFGRDFGDVRVHTDDHAAASARAVGARAYTVGERIVFGAGEYAAHTAAGQGLLAHELTHVVQGRSGSASGLSRAVGRLDCTGGVASAPADPAAELADIDGQARTMAAQLGADFAADATTVRGGIPDAPSASLQSYIDHFGLPGPEGNGFLNRITGVVRPSQETAASEELQILSRRFALIARILGDRIHYACGDAAINLGGGCADDCTADGFDAFACRGTSGIGLCPTFWTGYADNTARAAVVIHEMFHMVFGVSTPRQVGEVGDETLRGAGRNFNVAECYESIVDDVFATDSHVDCPPIP